MKLNCEFKHMQEQVLWRGRYLMRTAERRMRIYVPLPATSSESVPVMHTFKFTIPLTPRCVSRPPIWRKEE